MAESEPITEPENKLLIVDDDVALQQQLRWAFDDIEVSLAGNRDEALAQFSAAPTPVVLLDLGLPPDRDGPSEGLATLQSILRRADPERSQSTSGWNHVPSRDQLLVVDLLAEFADSELL